MRWFLRRYLAITGCMALVALLMPMLVVIGMFLILPGLILALAPTAFLWGCVVALSWWLAKRFLGDNRRSAVCAFALGAGVLVAIPAIARLPGQRAYEASLRPDVAPSRPIAMKGDIRIDRQRPEWDNVNPLSRTPAMPYRGFACDHLCMALLFTPGVTSVTINDSDKLSELEQRDGTGGFDPEARTYRLLPKAQCAGRAVLPDLEAFAPTPLSAGWNLRLASDVCLVRSAPIAHHDLLIRQGEYGRRDWWNDDWYLGPSGPLIEYVEIRNAAGDTLLRRFKSSVAVLSHVLFVDAQGGIENFRFGWGRQTLTNKPAYNAIDLWREVDAHTNTLAKAQATDLLPQLRKQLTVALADPSLTWQSPAFQLLPTYFDALSNPLAPEDVNLVSKLARDDRLARYDGLYKLSKLPLSQQAAIRDAFVQRALATADPVRLASSGANTFIEKMPPGSFAVLTTDESRLLALPDKRAGLYALSGRLDDGGPKNVPLILLLIRDENRDRHAKIAAANQPTQVIEIGKPDRSYYIYSQEEPHEKLVSAARDALCRMGTAAAAARQPLEAMIADGTINAQDMKLQRDDWNFTLARLGTPVERLTKPTDRPGTAASYQQWLRDKLARFEPDRGC